jgi:endonuclease/exonuclease/phosphatase family metal-dependent hydrolase
MLTYNIHHGEGTDGVFDLERIAAVIKSVEPDLVALQEVDRNTGRSGEADQAAELARLTGLEFYFGRAMDYDGGEYGVAILTRFSFEWSRTYLLSAEEGRDPRTVAVIGIDLPNGDRLDFAGTHLDSSRVPTSRLMQVSEINEFFSNRARRAVPAILAGDLNATVDQEEMQILLERWNDAAAECPEPTIPVAKPSRRIDYVLYTPSHRFQVIETRVLDEQVASDHRPLLAVLDLLPPDPSR